MTDAEQPDAASGVLSVRVEDHQSVEVDLHRWQAFTQQVLRAEGIGRGILTIALVDADEIAELKARDLDGDGSTTDVLAYPLDCEEGRTPDDGVPVLLGDIVLCVTEAERNARAANKSTNDEIELLLVHAVLHLLGHDHAEPEEAAVMAARELELLAVCSS